MKMQRFWVFKAKASAGKLDFNYPSPQLVQ
jgi:hypothetical protein